MKPQRITPSQQQIDSIRNGDKFITIGGIQLNTWDRYHFEGLLRPPRPILVEFLSSHKGEFKSAIDLGAGSFADSKYIASQGIPVRAIDQKLNVGLLEHQYLNNPSPSEVQNNLTVQAQDFAHLQLPRVDLIYSFASLPFCPERHFVNMLMNVASSVNSNGYVALHFFESKHPFVKNGKARGFSAEQLESAFNLLGFTSTETTEWTDKQVQSGEKLKNLNSIFLTAQAPEQLKNVTCEELQEILGLRTQQKPHATSAKLAISKIYGFSGQGTSYSVEPLPEGLTEVRGADSQTPDITNSGRNNIVTNSLVTPDPQDVIYANATTLISTTDETSQQTAVTDEESAESTYQTTADMGEEEDFSTTPLLNEASECSLIDNTKTYLRHTTSQSTSKEGFPQTPYTENLNIEDSGMEQ